MFPRWSLSIHPLRDTLEFSADSINHLSGMWSYYFCYSPIDILRFPEETAPMLLKLAHPTVNRGHLQRILSRAWRLFEEKGTETLRTDTILINSSVCKETFYGNCSPEENPLKSEAILHFSIRKDLIKEPQIQQQYNPLVCSFLTKINRQLYCTSCAKTSV